MEQSFIQVYLEAIERELKKRATTYPKLLAKAKKNGMPADEFDELCAQQREQNRKLANAIPMLEMVCDPQVFHPEFLKETLGELQRELQMRKKCYSHFVWKKRMTQTEADNELLIWKAICGYFVAKISARELFNLQNPNP